MDKKKLLGIAILISVVTSALLIVFTADRQTLDAVLSVRLEYIIAAVFIHIFAYYLTSKKTQHLCSAIGCKISSKNAFFNTISGLFIAALTPSSAGGEPIRILLLKRSSEIPVGKGTAVVIMERMIDGFLVLILLIPSFFIVNKYVEKSGVSTNITNFMLLVSVLCVVFVVLLLIYMLRKPENTYKIFEKLIDFVNKVTKKKYEEKLIYAKQRIGEEMKLFYESFNTLIRSGKFSLFMSFIFTLLSWTGHFSIIWFILKGLNFNESFVSIFPIMCATQIMLLLITAIPTTPGSSGIAEIGGYTLFSLFIPVKILAVVVIVWRAITYYVNIIVGALANAIAVKKFGIDFLNNPQKCQ
ncbi:MAG: flippase-like domain-containing protein [Methanosarcinaceae archaeon]|nr:flippase-like domain-containing protein [Methanosarcinaceae archaeon]